MSQNFRKLRVWEMGIKWSKSIYQITSQFPKEEIFGLTSQLKRASSSIPANIAEWSGRNSQKDFNHFLSIAHWSANEVITFLTLAHELTYISKEDFDKLSDTFDHIASMIVLLQKTLSV